MALVIQGYVRALSALESQITFLVPSLLPLPLCRFPAVPSSKLPFFWESRSVVSDSAISWTIQSMEFSRPEYWGSLSLPQGIFPTPGSNPGLAHCRQILY